MTILLDSKVKQFCLRWTAIAGQSSEGIKEKVDKTFKKIQYGRRCGCKSESMQEMKNQEMLQEMYQCTLLGRS